MTDCDTAMPGLDTPASHDRAAAHRAFRGLRERRQDEPKRPIRRHVTGASRRVNFVIINRACSSVTVRNVTGDPSTGNPQLRSG